jgi:hypothetical protein
MGACAKGGGGIAVYYHAFERMKVRTAHAQDGFACLEASSCMLFPMQRIVVTERMHMENRVPSSPPRARQVFNSPATALHRE